MENKETNNNNNTKKKTNKQNIIIILATAIFALQLMTFISAQAINELSIKQQKVMFKVKY